MVTWKNEFEFVRFLQRMRFSDRAVAVGIGDDTALVTVPCKNCLFTTDMMIENVHFGRDTCAPEWLGHKLLARNVSDIAAMGGWPAVYLVSLAIPPDLSPDFLPRFFRGLKRAQRAMQAQLVGGDLSSSPDGVLFSSVALLGGTVNAPLLRTGARPRDSIWVTGSLGMSAAALELLKNGKAAVDTKRRIFSFPESSGPRQAQALRRIMKAHFLPQPRLEVGCWLAKHKAASAMIDLSDGLSTDLNRLCAASRVGAVIHWRDIPISHSVRHWARDPLTCALHGGEDYELLFTVPARAEAKVKRFSGTVPLRRIGEIVTAKEGVHIEVEGKLQWLDPGGFDHLCDR